MTDYRMKERTITILRLANRPMMVRELLPAIILGGQKEKAVKSSICDALRKLESEGQVRLVDQVFLKGGSWVQRWEAVQ